MYFWKGEVLLTQTVVYSQSFQASICGFTMKHVPHLEMLLP